MNFTKGFERIIMIIGIVSMVPSFYVGYRVCHIIFAKEECIKKINNELLATGLSNGMKGPRTPMTAFVEVIATDRLESCLEDSKGEIHHQLRNIFAGIFSAILGFVILLFGFRLFVKLSKPVFSWVINGFQNK